MTQPSRPAPESWDEATDLRRFWWLVAPLTFALLTAGVAAATGALRPDTSHEKTAHAAQTFTLSGTPNVSVENAWGPVTIERHNDPTVTVTVDRKATGRSGNEATSNLDSLDLFIGQDGNTITVRTVFNTDQPSANVMSTVHVSVPQRTDLNISTGGDGTLVVRGVDGDMLLHNGQQDIDVEMPAGVGFDIRANVKVVRSPFVITEAPTVPRWAFRTILGDPPLRVVQAAAPNGDLILRREA